MAYEFEAELHCWEIAQKRIRKQMSGPSNFTLFTLLPWNAKICECLSVCVWVWISILLWKYSKIFTLHSILVSKGVVPHKKKLYIPFRYILSSFVRNPNCKSVCVGILHKFMLIEFIDFLPASYYFPWFNTLPCISVYEWACGRNPLCIT